jgi:hypothetical protein
MKIQNKSFPAEFQRAFSTNGYIVFRRISYFGGKEMLNCRGRLNVFHWTNTMDWSHS